MSQQIDNEQNRNGFFRIQYRSGFAALAVYPPIGSGKYVQIDDVLKKMRVLHVHHVNSWDIETIVNEQKGVWVNVVRWPEGIDYVTKVEVAIDKDNMSATLNIVPPNKVGDELTKEEVLARIHEEGVRYGLLHAQIEKMVKDRICNLPCVIARGTPPTPGKSMHIKYLFNTEVGKPYKIEAYGRINLRELNFINNVKANHPIAKLKPPLPGKPGTNVRGEVIQAPPVLPQNIRFGPNTQLLEKERTIISTIDGNVFIRGNTLQVEPLVTVENVDYSTGNIHFDGSVQVTGTVCDGFIVEATGTIEIGECVGKVTIKAGKDVILRAGINGNAEGKVTCDGNIYAKFIEHAVIVCYGSIYTEELILHSTIRCWQNILLKGRRAEICGGKTITAGSIWCKRAGSINGIKTKLLIGIEPQKLKEIEGIKKILKKKNEELLDLKEKNKFYRANPVERRKIGIDMNELKTHIGKIKEDIKENEVLLRNCYAKLSPKPGCMLVAEEIIYNGTKVEFGKEMYRAPNNDSRRTILRFVNNSISEEGFNYREQPELG